MSKKNNHHIKKKDHSLLQKRHTGVVARELHWEIGIKQAIKYLMLATLLAPFINLSGFLYPAVFTKITAFYFLIDLMLALYLVLIFLDRNYLPKFSYILPEGKRKFDWIFISATAYVATIFISNIFSINSYQSFWGSLAFANGFLTIIHFYFLYVVTANVLREELFWRLFLRASVVGGMLMSLVAIYQGLNTGAPSMGFFGNPGYLAGYLVFIFFQSVVLFFWEKELKWKNLSCLTLLASAIVVLFFTEIRSAALGLMGGSVAGAGFFFIAHRNKTIRKTAMMALFTLLVLFAGLSAYYVRSEKIYTFFERSYTIKTRFIAWRAGINGFLDRPLVGYGSENYEAVFEKYFDPAFTNQGDGSAGTDSGSTLPHNKLIEVAVSNGILALLAYLGIFAAVFWKIFQKYNESRERIYLGLAGLLTGYAIHLFFLFDNPMTFAFFFLALSFLSHFHSKEALTSKRVENKNPKMVYVFSGAAAVIFLLAFSFFVIRPMKANYAGAQMLAAVGSGKYETAGEYLEKMKQEELFYIDDAAMVGAINHFQLSITEKGSFSPEKSAFLRKTIQEQEAVVRRNPLIFNSAIKLGLLYNLAGAEDKSYYEKTIKLLEDVISKGTKRVDAYYLLSGAYGQLGNAEKVADLAQRGIALDPTYAYAYYLFGGVYYEMKDYAKAAQYFKSAIDKKYANGDSYKMLADAYIGLNDYPAAISAYEQLVKLKTKDAQLEANLLMLYINGNQPDKARAKGAEIKQRFPSTESQINQLLNKLPK